MSSPLAAGRSIHIVGCAGAGMSALARVLAERGCHVSGCDQRDSDALRELRESGVVTYVGHSGAHLEGVEVVTSSPAISQQNPEMVSATKRGIEIFNRAQIMESLSRDCDVVGFAGTHGKTTTSSMAAHIWHAARRDPSWLIGAAVVGLGSNGHFRNGAALVAEVDESYGTFALMTPYALGVTNVDPDHLDFYRDEETLRAAFVSLVQRTRGPVALWTDHPGARHVAEAASREVTRVGRSAGCDVVISDEQFSTHGSTFRAHFAEQSCEISLRVPGALNVTNAAVAAAVAWRCGIELHDIASGLGNFVGVARRFEPRGTVRGTHIVDDYAHLPAEVAATIGAARAMGYERIVAVFQPHRITRTVALADSFAGAFDGVSELIVTDIYRAGEENPDDVTGELVTSAVAPSANFAVRYVASLDDAAAALAEHLGRADLILVLGAGDVDRVIDLLSGATS